MPKEEWGTKRVCPTTGKRFYDMNRDPVVSHYTGQVVNLETARQSRVLVADKADRAHASEEEEEVLLDDEDIDDDSSDSDLDDDLLEDDDDDSVSLDDIADVPGNDDEG